MLPAWMKGVFCVLVRFTPAYDGPISPMDPSTPLQLPAGPPQPLAPSRPHRCVDLSQYRTLGLMCTLCWTGNGIAWDSRG